MTPTDKPMTVEALEAIAREVGQMERRHCIGKAQGFDIRDGYAELRAAIEQYGKEQYARGVNDAWPAGRGSGEPVAMLHDDGHWTHPPGRDPLDRFSGKVRMEVYAAPQPPRFDTAEYARLTEAAGRGSGEPVAWVQPDHLEKARVAPFLCRVEPTRRMADFVPIYTAPQSREPLTDEQIISCFQNDEDDGSDEAAIRIGRAIIAKYERTHNIRSEK